VVPACSRDLQAFVACRASLVRISQQAVVASTKELDNLVAERDILAADTR
jgi:hypothetical protein